MEGELHSGDPVRYAGTTGKALEGIVVHIAPRRIVIRRWQGSKRRYGKPQPIDRAQIIARIDGGPQPRSAG